MDSALTDRQKTSLLKGIAILAVLVNHYVNAHLTTMYAGYANGVIALFFVLSGYGLSFSLAGLGELNSHAVTAFYRKRLLRIYPLYWLALLCAALFWQKTYSLATITAFPLHQASGIYWFISSLLQCYLIAPFLYKLLRAKGLRGYLGHVLGTAALLQGLYFSLGLPFASDYFVYRDFFLGHLLLFALGLGLAGFRQDHAGRSDLDYPLLLGACLFFSGGVWATRPQDTIAIQDALLIAPFFVSATVLLVYSSLRARFSIPANRFRGLILIGEYSYSLYLFHLLYYSLLEKMGLIVHGSVISALLTIALSPLFILFCRLLEERLKRLVNHLQQKWRTGEARP